MVEMISYGQYHQLWRSLAAASTPARAHCTHRHTYTPSHAKPGGGSRLSWLMLIKLARTGHTIHKGLRRPSVYPSRRSRGDQLYL
jgi:hypothetical protein